jgi:hypothetical protein
MASWGAKDKEVLRLDVINIKQDIDKVQSEKLNDACNTINKKIDSSLEEVNKVIGQNEAKANESLLKVEKSNLEAYSELKSGTNNSLSLLVNYINTLNQKAEASVAEVKNKAQTDALEIKNSIESAEIKRNQLEFELKTKNENIMSLIEQQKEVINDVEAKAKAENKVLEQFNDRMFQHQVKQMKQLKIGLCIALIINLGQIIYEIIK